MITTRGDQTSLRDLSTIKVVMLTPFRVAPKKAIAANMTSKVMDTIN